MTGLDESASGLDINKIIRAHPDHAHLGDGSCVLGDGGPDTADRERCRECGEPLGGEEILTADLAAANKLNGGLRDANKAALEQVAHLWSRVDDMGAKLHAATDEATALRASVEHLTAELREQKSIERTSFRVLTKRAVEAEQALILANIDLGHLTAERDQLRQAFQNHEEPWIREDASADAECCASGRCEVCTPGYEWGNS